MGGIMALAPDQIRAEADRILASGSFQRSERLSGFLRFVVDSALQGRHEQLKEYVLGVEVYQKGADFDPRLDSTVRVEAARLRSKLREYYDTEGRKDAVRIELPKGRYVPVFRCAEQPASPVRRKAARMAWVAGFLVAASIGLLVYGLVLRSERRSVTKVVPLTTWPGLEFNPHFSPDGRQVALVWSGENDDNYDIYVKPIGEGPRVRLTTHPATDRNPVWSPDGHWIAFLRHSTTGVGLYLVPALGGAERRIAELRHPAGPATGKTLPLLEWFPDAQTLAVVERSSSEGCFSIFRLSVETGERRRLTSPPPESYGDTQPAVSPDGRMLAFARSLALASSDIYIVPVKGGEPRRLTFDNEVIVGMTWSADGRSIVFSSERGATAGAGSLWRIRVDSSISRAPPEQVLGVGPRASYPAISRRGRLLAYQEHFQDSNLWRAPASGRGAPELVIASTREEVRPDYSPDGRRIVFDSNRSGNWEVWIANADGSDSRQLTNYGRAPASSPRWSPDGRLIAFHYIGEGNADIYTMTPEGKSIRRLTSEPSREESPSWSKDGRWIYFTSNRSGVFEIWKMAVDNATQVVQMTHGGGNWPRESPEGRYLYFLDGGDIWRMPVDGGPKTRVYGPVVPGPSRAPDPAGIYAAEAGRGIVYHHFATGRTTLVVPLGKSTFMAYGGLALAPDRRWLLYARRDRAVSDIMLVQNFQ